MAEKKPPSEKQLNMRAVAEIVSTAIDRDLTSSEWGQFGRMINNFGFPIVKDSAEKFAQANLPLEEKRKCAVPYMWGILKQSKIEVERDDAAIADILRKDRSV